jgi:hypothetical protein
VEGELSERVLPVSLDASPLIVNGLGDISPPSVRGVNLRVEGAEGWDSGVSLIGSTVQGLGYLRVEGAEGWDSGAQDPGFRV